MTVLDDIITGVREDLAARQAEHSLIDLMEQARAVAPAQEIVSRFREPGLSVIAEVKRRSPSKGDLAEITDPAALAEAYLAGGATAVSVLTEQRRFSGSLADLDAVRERVSAPLLRKDFMVESYQFYEARAHGADLALLIVAALSDAELRAFMNLTDALGMTALVETHTEEEVDRAVEAGASIIGVNNRSLKTLDVDIAQFGKLAARIPDDRIKVAESGILSVDDARRVRDEGAEVVLVGEALVRHAEPQAAVAAFREIA
ncbi:MAG: indole-3-glycerol phosphate synthase TrpC [Propionibacteriaceae bacterium]|nr:indole-3-glycerol phosphate synthase TrpC [Propionibacteriaceae bacterium]